MATLEMVEKLKERANVSYDEARAALEACGDDLLEALIYLEKQGKVAPPQNGGRYSTRMEAAHGADGSYSAGGSASGGETFGDMMKRFWRWFCGVIEKGNANSFEVWRNGKCGFVIPVTAFVALLVFCFCFTLPLLVVGLFCGCKYRFRGPELDDSQMNDVMDSAARAADGIKNEVLRHEHDHDSENHSGEQQ